jgi:protein involved in polysaccharide export with SLBB domain
VQVLVRGFASQRVFVGGEVNSPGIYPIPGRVGIAEIVMLANGFRDTARQDSVVLIRRRSDGLPMLRVVNVSRFMGGQDGGDIPLSGSDIVFVPKSSIAEVNLFIEQYVNRVLPFNRNFSYTINRNTGNGAAVVNGTPTVTTQ